MRAKPLVSIIVPCYKQAHYLDQSLQSILDQTYDNWECIIVNDGSPDDTEGIAFGWLQRDKRFDYLSQHNQGLSAARNTGIRQSKGEYILVLDADDILHEDFLKLTLQELENNRKISIVSCYRLFFREKIDDAFYSHEPKGENIDNLLFENILMPSSLFRRHIWQDVGGYDEQMKNGFEDWEFWVSALKNGGSFKIVPEHLFYYRKAKRSMLTDTLKHHQEDIRAYIFKKHSEVYTERFGRTIDYLTYLISKHRSKEVNLQNSLDYRLGRLMLKPFRLLSSLVGKKNSSKDIF